MGWMIFGGIVLLFVFLFSRFLTIKLDYYQDFVVKIKYLFFTIYKYPAPEKPDKKEKKKKEKRKSKKSSAKKPEKATPTQESADNLDKGEEKTTSTPKPKLPKKQFAYDKMIDLMEKVKLFVSSAKKPLQKLIKKTLVDIKLFHAMVGGEDAAQAAMNYGKVNLIFSNAVGWLDAILKLKLGDIDINADFQTQESTYKAEAVIKIRVFTALVCVISFFLNMTKSGTKINPKK